MKRLSHKAIREREVYFIICGLLVFVVLLSVFFFSKQSLRLDEAQSLWQSSHSPRNILSIIAQDVHVPLYALLLHFWQFFLGNGVVVGRVLSLLFFLISIPAMYRLGKITFGVTVGLFAAVLFAVSPFLNWYGNEMRMYSLFTLVIILNQYFFMRIFHQGKQQSSSNTLWLYYGVTVVIGTFTHYFFFLGLFTEFIFFLAYRKHFPNDALKKFIVVALAALVCYIPWLLFVLHLGAAQNSQPLLTAPNTVNVFNTFSQFLFGFQNDHINTILVSLWPLSILLVFLSLRKNKVILPENVFFILSAFIPVILVFLISITVKPIYLTRYLVLALPSLYLVISSIFSMYPPRLSRVLKAVLVLAMIVTLGIEAVSATTPVKENYREVSDFLRGKATPEDVIVVSAPFTIYPLEYYYTGETSIESLPLWNRFITGPIPSFDEAKLPDEVNTIKGEHVIAWLVLSYDQGYESKIKNYFDTHFERIDARSFSPGLNVYGYKLRYNAQGQ